MKLGLYYKLVAGFGLCLILMAVMICFNFAAFLRVSDLHQKSLKRSLNMKDATDAQHIGEDLYLIIAEAVIKRNPDKTERMWAASKIENRANLQKVKMAADTPEERAMVKEAEEAINEIIRIFEQEMFPLVKQGGELTGPIADMDARIGRKIETVHLVLQNVARSMSEENQRTVTEFQKILTRSIGSGFIISLIGLLAAISISAMTTRRIMRPLSEITRAALEVEKGNYVVELEQRSNDEIGILTGAFRKMSEQVARNTIELEQRVRERTTELSNANFRLEQEIVKQKSLEQQLVAAKRLEFIGQLAAGVAHEVRNPLNTILLNTEALFREEEIAVNPELGPYMQHIRTQVDRLALLMNDLLDLGKEIPAENLKPVIIYDFCRDAINQWISTGAALGRQVLLVNRDESAVTEVLADSLKLQQVLFNLLENAAQHTPRGGEILFGLIATVECETSDGMAIVRIIDAGCGIPEEKIARVFEPFYTGRKGGTGLGLALVKHFVEHMGGTIIIRNNDPPPGCIAEVRIPVAGKDRG